VTPEALYDQSDKNRLMGLILKVSVETNFSGRKIAELTGVNRNFIQRILKEKSIHA
jgi:hypothetical protein